MERRSVKFLASWVAIAALLLRAAVPLFAAGAAQWRGVAVGSVCEVYGVVLPGVEADGHAGHLQHAGALVHAAGHPGHGGHVPDAGAAHSGDHCALTALAELAASQPPLAALVGGGRSSAVVAVSGRSPRSWADPSATWIARRKQGPPTAG